MEIDKDGGKGTRRYIKGKSRGLSKLEHKVGSIRREIEDRLKRGSGPVKVLEVGFGHGGTLLDIGSKYGERVELHGVNKAVEHGDTTSVLDLARIKGIDEVGFVSKINLHYFDVCEPWPFPDNEFDLIYSQAVFIHLRDKVFTLQEINRALKPDGIARIQLRIFRPKHPPQYAKNFIIYDGDREIELHDYIRSFPNLNMDRTSTGIVHRIARAARSGMRTLLRKKQKPFDRQPYLEMTKAVPFDMGLTLFQCNETLRPVGGAQSIYHVRPTSEKLEGKS